MGALIDRIRRAVMNTGIRKKLLLIYCAAGLVPMGVIGSLMLYNTHRMLYGQYRGQLESENKRVHNIVFEVTYLVSNISNVLGYDSALNTLLSTSYESDGQVYEAYRAYPLLDSFAENYTELSSIRIYFNNPTMVSSGRFQYAGEEVQASEWYRLAKESSGEPIWICEKQENSQDNLFLVRKVPLYNRDFAVISIGISSNFLKLMINDEQTDTLLSLDEGEVFYAGNASYFGKPLPVSQTALSETRVRTLRDNGLLVGCSALQPVRSHQIIQVLTVDSHALGAVNRTMVLMMAIILFCILIPFVLIFLFTGSFGRRIAVIRGEMHKISEGNLDIIPLFDGTDELGLLFRDMQQTINNIQNLNRQLYENQLDRQRLMNQQRMIEFQMLANQINPHFLFNTLETIRMNASTHKDPDTAYIIPQLGKMMRYSLQTKDQLVSLAQELAYTRSYLEIQHFRYREKISYEILVSDEITQDTYYLMPLLIQPLVENAISHGISPMDGPGFLLIHIEPVKDHLSIVIHDNGVGMDEGALQALRESVEAPEPEYTEDPVPTERHIGLRNVSSRIRLFYGREYGVDIESRPMEGTAVTLRLPLPRTDGPLEMEKEKEDERQ